MGFFMFLSATNERPVICIKRNRIQPYEYIHLAQEISEVWDGGTDGEEKKHTKGSAASGACIV